MAAIHLRSGYDVILPILPGKDYASAYEEVAREVDAEFTEVFVHVEKEEAIRRLLARGTWGEAGLPPITQEHLPRIEHLFDEMVDAVAQRPNLITVESVANDIDGTYEALIEAIS